MVLCYSRMMYVEFTVSQTMEHFLTCHQNAFEFFGSVPKRVMVDNLKSAVLRRILGRPPVFNPKYLDFANHYGFAITPCNVGKGNEKGRVENAVGYVKKNFLAGLDIPTLSPLLLPRDTGWRLSPMYGSTEKPAKVPWRFSKKSAPAYPRWPKTPSMGPPSAKSGPPANSASPWTPTATRCRPSMPERV